VDENWIWKGQGQETERKERLENVGGREPDANLKFIRREHKNIQGVRASKDAVTDPGVQRRDVPRVLTGLHDPRFPRRVPHQHTSRTAEHVFKRVRKISRHEDNLHRIDGQAFGLPG
jgi:hypothetical protein